MRTATVLRGRGRGLCSLSGHRAMAAWAPRNGDVAAPRRRQIGVQGRELPRDRQLLGQQQHGRRGGASRRLDDGTQGVLHALRDRPGDAPGAAGQAEVVLARVGGELDRPPRLHARRRRCRRRGCWCWAGPGRGRPGRRRTPSTRRTCRPRRPGTPRPPGPVAARRGAGRGRAARRRAGPGPSPRRRRRPSRRRRWSARRPRRPGRRAGPGARAGARARAPRRTSRCTSSSPSGTARGR